MKATSSSGDGAHPEEHEAQEEAKASGELWLQERAGKLNDGF